jgi:hypothetical protein
MTRHDDIAIARARAKLREGDAADQGERLISQDPDKASR